MTLREMLISKKAANTTPPAVYETHRTSVSDVDKDPSIPDSVPYYTINAVTIVVEKVLNNNGYAVCKNDKFICAEYEKNNKTYCAVLNVDTNEIKRAFVVDDSGNITPFSFFSDDDSLGEALVLVGIGKIYENDSNTLPSIESSNKLLYYADLVINSDALNVEIPASGNFSPVTQRQVDSYACHTLLEGTPHIFIKPSDSDKYLPTVTFEDLVRNQDLKLSDGKEELVPKLDVYVVPPWLHKAVKKIVRFYDCDDSAGNLMLYGPSGSGKTLGCKAMAQVMGLPYYTHVFSSDSDLYNSTVQVLPKTGNDVELSYDDIRYNPEDSYCKITGEQVDGITSNEVFEAYTASKNGYNTVPSAIIEAIQKPSFLELQEVFTAPPAVVTFLNSLIDGSKSIRLITGETISRHPKSIIAITTNVGYSGYRESTESFLDRLTPIKVSTPTDEDIIARLIANTGMDKQSSLAWLCELRRKCEEFVIENGITHATYGYRMLEKVVREIQFRVEDGENLKDATIGAAMEIIPYHISRNDEEQKELIDSVITPETLKLT